MTRDQAILQLQTFFRSQGLESAGLNANDVGGMSVGDAQLAFEFVPAKGTLRCAALIYRFRAMPKAAVLDSFRAEEKAGTEAGGGVVEYDPIARAVFLSRSYAQPVEDATFRAELERLIDASRVWRTDIVPRVAERAFRNDLR